VDSTIGLAFWAITLAVLVAGGMTSVVRWAVRRSSGSWALRHPGWTGAGLLLGCHATWAAVAAALLAAGGPLRGAGILSMAFPGLIQFAYVVPITRGLKQDGAAAVAASVCWAL